MHSPRTANFAPTPRLFPEGLNAEEIPPTPLDILTVMGVPRSPCTQAPCALRWPSNTLLTPAPKKQPTAQAEAG